MKTLIVDDERLARSEMRRLLKPFSEIAIVGEAANAEQARALIAALNPNLLFLDIQMPGQNGFELLASLDRVPAVIFTTAYDDYALKAFEVNALDYLLKPIDPRRLAAAINKVLARTSGLSDEADSSSPLGQGDQVFLSDGERCWFVRLKDIRLLESEGNYTRLYFDANRPLLLRSLNQLEQRLDPKRFFRASRKHIINLSWIEAMQAGASGKLIVRLAGDLEVEMSRRQSQKFKEQMGL
jgi:two-component system, LytTR family, response regulator